MLTILHCLPYTSFRGYATNKGIFTSLCAAGLLEGVSPDLQPYVPHAHTRGSQTLHVLGVRQRLLSQLRPEKARVLFQVEVATEAFAARRAREGFAILVCVHVERKVVDLVKRLRADLQRTAM